MSDAFAALLIGLGLGVTFFAGGIFSLKRKLLIENTPTSKIRSLAMGLVEIYGEVVPAEREILKSPLTGKDCVYYKYKVEEYRQSGKSGHWATIRSGEDMVRFFLKDDTGMVLVDPNRASVEIPKDFGWERGFMGKDPPGTVMKFMEQNDLHMKGFLGFNRNMRVSEHYIAPGDRLYIMGDAGDNPFVEEGTAKQSTEDVMIQKGPSKIYYISDSAEKDILRKLAWKTWGGILGGGFLIACCLILIFLYLGLPI
jgi:hypothetical protein